jgi:putative peptidoglycan lipid II flippase
MAAFVFSNLVGLLRSVLIAHAFGTGAELEAFTPANRVTEVLFNLVAGGALASAFIPTFTELLVKEDRRGAWRLASAVANWVLAGSTIAALLAGIFAPQVVRYLLAPGFAADPEKLQLTVSLMRLMLPTVVIFGLSGLVMGILNSHQIFLIPALTPSMYSFGLIFGTLVLAPRLGIYGLAWGAVTGALLHLGLQMPSLLKLKDRAYFPSLAARSEPVREVGRLLAPRLLGVAVVQLNFWINIVLASSMPEGSINGINYAFTIMLMPQAAIAQSIAVAAMPTFAAQVARGQLGEMRSALAAVLRGVLLLSIPASVGLALLRTPIVALLYQQGEFTAQSTALVAWALLWYAAGLVGHSLVEVLARAFYAAHDTRTPVLVGAAAMLLNILLSLLFAALFRAWGWMPHGGLALANSVATGLEMVGLLALMRRRLGGLEGSRVLRSALAAGAASAAMAAGLLVVRSAPGLSANWMQVLAGLAAGVLVYAAAVFALRVPEARSLLGFVLSRIK